MIRNYLKLHIYLFLISLVLSFNNVFALPGSEIIKNAIQHLTWRWYCNDWNAREGYINGIFKSNKDDNPDNNDIRYPFYPEGAKYKDENGNIVISDGYHTGVAYGWGLGDTIGNYNSKLTNRNPEFLVGNYTDQINIQMYAGVDCSGFLARSIGFPVLKVNPSHPTLGNYYILHPTTEDFIEEIFTDEIEWGEIKKGDILIRRYYEEDTNGDGRISSNERHYGHIGIAMGKPNGTTQKNFQLKKNN